MTVGIAFVEETANQVPGLAISAKLAVCEISNSRVRKRGYGVRPAPFA